MYTKFSSIFLAYITLDLPLSLCCLLVNLDSPAITSPVVVAWPADSWAKTANSPVVNLPISRKLNWTFCKTNRIICCLIYSTSGTINYNYVKCRWVEMQTFYAVIPYPFSPYHLPLALPSCSFQFAAVCANHNQAKALGDLLALLAFSISVNENLADWQARPGQVPPGGWDSLFFTAQFPLLTLATFINVIGHRQILGALAGLLLGITNGPGKAALQGILALVAELLLPSTGIICKEQERECVRERRM